MMPEWIRTIERTYEEEMPCREKELIAALTIAWEALEELKDIRYESRAKEVCDDSDYPARVALSRISKLGGGR